MAAGNQEFRVSMKALSFHSRTSTRAHKHIYIEMVILLKILSRGKTFFNETAFLFWCQAL